MDTFSTSFVYLLTLGYPFLPQLTSHPCLLHLKDVASSISSSLETIKSTLFFKISFWCSVLHFQLFFSLDGGRLKLFANCSISVSIVFKCLHFDKIVLLFSLSLMCLFTSLFWRLSNGVKNYLVLVSFYIFCDFVFSLCSLLIISIAHSVSILWNKIYRL